MNPKAAWSDLYCRSPLFIIFSTVFPTTGPRQTLWGSWDAGVLQVFYRCVIIAHLCTNSLFELLINCFNLLSAARAGCFYQPKKTYIMRLNRQIFSSKDESWCFHIYLGELKVYFNQTSVGGTVERRTHTVLMSFILFKWCVFLWICEDPFHNVVWKTCKSVVSWGAGLICPFLNLQLPLEWH